MERKRLIIIDANSVIHRAFHALPPLTTKKGELTNAIYGFLLVFLKAIKDFQPDYLAAAFDLPFPTFRHKEFKNYKAQRPPTPKELYLQIPKIKEILRAFNLPIFEKKGFEADDIIGTLVSQPNRLSKKENLETVVVSGDLDTLQLVNENTKVYHLRKGVKDVVLYDEKLVKEKFQGLSPKQLLDFKALRGDPSDNIPGVRGIGEKTAIKLIKEFSSLENLYSALGQPAGLKAENQRFRVLLEKQKEQAFLSKKLVEIKKDVPIKFSLEKCRWGNYDREKVFRGLEELEFYTLIERLSKITEREKAPESKPRQKELNLWQA